jgi:hypothetical protein
MTVNLFKERICNTSLCGRSYVVLNHERFPAHGVCPTCMERTDAHIHGFLAQWKLHQGNRWQLAILLGIAAG